jgi:hypothetical protein
LFFVFISSSASSSSSTSSRYHQVVAAASVTLARRILEAYWLLLQLLLKFRHASCSRNQLPRLRIKPGFLSPQRSGAQGTVHLHSAAESLARLKNNIMNE